MHTHDYTNRSIDRFIDGGGNGKKLPMTKSTMGRKKLMELGGSTRVTMTVDTNPCDGESMRALGEHLMASSCKLINSGNASLSGFVSVLA